MGAAEWQILAREQPFWSHREKINHLRLILGVNIREF